MNIQSMGGISPLWVDQSVEAADKQNKQPTLFADIFQSAIDDVKETEAVKNEPWQGYSRRKGHWTLCHS